MTDTPAGRPLRIYIDLVADLFHAGHLRHLEKARKLGGSLVVGVFGDDDAARLSHVPVMSLAERTAVVAALRCVDEVVSGAPVAPDEAFLDLYDIDYACLSDDYGDADRRQALAALADGGCGIVLPYTEDVTTAAVVGRITGEMPEAPDDGALSAVVHEAPPPPDAQPEPRPEPAMLAELRDMQRATLDAMAALSSAYLGRSWLADRERLGNKDWIRFMRCVAQNALQRAAHRPTDPRFVPALVGLAGKAAAPGSHVAIVGAAAAFVASALQGDGRRVTVLRPGVSAPSGGGAPERAAFDTVYCDWGGIPDACPDADAMVVLDTPVSTWLLMDRELLSATAARLRYGLLMAVDFAPEAGASYHPHPETADFVFPDAFARSTLHLSGFFEVADLLTTVDGAPMPAGAGGCLRRSRSCLVAEDMHGDRFRYLDGAPAVATGQPSDGRFVRWYHASRLSGP